MLCAGMSHGPHPGLNGKGQEFCDALQYHLVLFNSEIWAAAEFAFPEAASQGAAVEAALDVKALKTPPKLQQACTKGDIAAVRELLRLKKPISTGRTRPVC